MKICYDLEQYLAAIKWIEQKRNEAVGETFVRPIKDTLDDMLQEFLSRDVKYMSCGGITVVHGSSWQEDGSDVKFLEITVNPHLNFNYKGDGYKYVYQQ